MGSPLLTGDVARILKCSAEHVRQLENVKQLVARKTENGTRIFDSDDVQRLAREREARTETRSRRW